MLKQAVQKPVKVVTESARNTILPNTAGDELATFLMVLILAVWIVERPMFAKLKAYLAGDAKG